MTELSRQLGIPGKKCSELAAALVGEMADQLTDENSIAIQGFGTFEVKKRLERVVMNPVTRKRMLVPPKLSLNFKPSALLKEKLK